jgi:predicted esterase
MPTHERLENRFTRRRFGAIAGSALATVAFGEACGAAGIAHPSSDGRLTARPRSDVKTTATGTKPLGLGADRDAILQMPSKAVAGPVPLLVLMHGAGGRADRLLKRFGPAADHAGVAVLAPDARDSTWDAIRGEFGADVGFLDRALARVFETVEVDPARLAVGGFSDGATYAIAIGLVNGDLFGRVLAFSPGFLVEGTPYGKPKVFVSHGTADPILPIERCSRIIVPALRKRGYDVVFREFDGGHEVPVDIGIEGMAWMRSPSGDRT